MTTTTLMFALVFGAGALALWLNARFGAYLPDRHVPVFLHLIAASAALEIALPAGLEAVPATTPLGAVVAVQCVVLPCLTYLLLATLRLLHMMRGVLGGSLQ